MIKVFKIRFLEDLSDHKTLHTKEIIISHEFGVLQYITNDDVFWTKVN